MRTMLDLPTFLAAEAKEISRRRCGSKSAVFVFVVTCCVAMQPLYGQPSVQAQTKRTMACSIPAELDTARKVGTASQRSLAVKYPVLSKKLDHRLLEAWQSATTDGVQPALTKLAAQKATIAENSQDVVVIVSPSPGTTMADLEALLSAVGVTFVRSGPDTIKVASPISLLDAVAEIPAVAHVRNLVPPRPKNTTTTEGLSVTLADAWHTEGHRGLGVKVAVVDASYADLVTLQSQDEIPASAIEVNYTASAMTAGSNSHGCACAEVVYDMAPDAQMHLIKIDDVTDLLAVKDYCITQGIHVVTCSLGWDALNFHDGIAYANGFTTAANHPVSAVDLATSAGILWVAVAGNEQRQHSLIEWRDAGTPDNALDWNASQGNLNLLWKDSSTTIPADTDINVYLTWNQWPISSEDFDLRLYRNTGSGWTLVAVSEDVQDGDADSYPYEEVFHQTTVAGEYAVLVLKFGTVTTPSFILRYYGVDEPNYFGYGNVSTPVPGSICIPGDAASTFTVGAIDHASYTNGPIEGFSSLGPNNRAYTGGAATTKPDICGPDFVTSVTYGGGGFGGTSSSTPHIAGLAALVKSAYPSYTQTQLKQYLESNGYDLGTSGKDDTYGSGASRLPSPPSNNHAPTDMGLSNSTVAENESTETTVGALNTTDPDAGDTFTYTLVSGTGDDDNASFSISGSNVQTTASFDYETTNTYTVRVRTTDQGNLWYEEAFTISVTDVDEPAPIFEAPERIGGDEVILRWSSISNHMYALHYSTNLVFGFDVLKTNLVCTPPMNTYTDNVNGVKRKFWKVSTGE